MNLCCLNERGGEVRDKFDAMNFFKKQRALLMKGKTIHMPLKQLEN
jgi:hypothetical protein